MYDRYFGLKQKPFKSNVVASDVFVGAEAKRLLKCLDSAFSYEDAVFLVTGPSGVGKSTLTKWALQEHSAKALLIRLPRARLSHDEVLDFLLDKLGATAVPTGMLRKLILCKKLIADLNKVGTPLAVLVEDATRVGEDGLVELENLTAADADEGSGARLVLLGNDNLAVSLRAAALARLRQRVRGRVELSALDARETGIYLAHCFAPTGRPFATLFAPGSAELLFDLSSGTPRLLNVLVESVLAAAMQLECDEIDLPLIQKVAETEHGLTASKAPAPEKTPAAAEVAAEPSVGGSNTITTRSLVVDSAGAANQRPRLDTTLPDLDELAPELAGGKRRDPVKALPQQPPPTSRSNEPMSAAPPRTADAGPSRSQFDQPAAMHADDDAIPTLFSSARMVAPTRADNLREPTVTPEVPAAPPAPTAQAKPPGVAKTVSAAGTATDAAPPDAQQPQQTADEQHPDTDPPAWDRDPTLAELRPDLEALELALAQSTDPEPERKAVPTEPDPVVELKEPTFYGVPEITLDVAIQQKISEATEALKKHDATIAEEDFDSAPKARDVAQNKPARTETKPAPQGAPKVAPEVAAKAAPKPAAMAAEKPATKAATEPKSAPLPKQKPPASAPARNSDFDELAAGIANARTLEDVDDRMAETLFGEEFSAIAAQVVAQVAANAPDSGDSYDDSGSLELELVNDESDDAQDDPGETEFEREFKNVYGEKALEVSLQSDVPRAGLDLSASQRLATVRALNANRGHAAAAATRSAPHAKGSTPTRSQPQAAPQPIEEQISTSMTQTLRALNARPKPANDDDDDAPKSGFFSRFKRS